MASHHHISAPIYVPTLKAINAYLSGYPIIKILGLFDAYDVGVDAIRI